MKIKKLLLSIVALVLVLLTGISLVGCDDSGDNKKAKENKKKNTTAKSVVEKFLKAHYVDMSAEDYYACFHEAVIDEWSNSGEEDIYGILDEDYQAQIDYLDDNYTDWFYSYEIVDKVDVPQDIIDSLSYYKDTLDLEFEETKEYLIDVTFSGYVDGEEQTQTFQDNVTAVKIDGKWYVAH